MAQFALGGPFDIVACAFGDEKRLAAALVAVAVNALLDREIKDGAR